MLPFTTCKRKGRLHHDSLFNVNDKANCLINSTNTIRTRSEYDISMLYVTTCRGEYLLADYTLLLRQTKDSLATAM